MMSDVTDSTQSRDLAIQTLLTAIEQSSPVITSVELASIVRFSHIRVMNLMGHLKRRGLVDAELIGDSSRHEAALYLVRSRAQVPTPAGRTHRQ